MSKPPPENLMDWPKAALAREVERLRAIAYEHAESNSDAPSSGGDIVDVAGDPYAHGGVVLDVRKAVLMDELDVSLVDPHPGSDEMPGVAILIQGRINFQDARARQLYLMEIDGAAALASELIALMHRAGGKVHDQFEIDFARRLRDMP